jgi:hypothetical protein
LDFVKHGGKEISGGQNGLDRVCWQAISGRCDLDERRGRALFLL